MTTGWQDAVFPDLRDGDPHIPDHDYRVLRPLRPGEIVEVRIELGPSATLFRAGEALVSTCRGVNSRPGTR